MYNFNGAIVDLSQILSYIYMCSCAKHLPVLADLITKSHADLL